jgi:hypothetical protein
VLVELTTASETRRYGLSFRSTSTPASTSEVSRRSGTGRIIRHASRRIYGLPPSRLPDLRNALISRTFARVCVIFGRPFGTIYSTNITADRETDAEVVKRIARS